MSPRRKALGEPPAEAEGSVEVLRKSTEGSPWTDEHLALLGKVPDPQLAEDLGVALSTVSRERRRRGIPACRSQRPAVAWTPEMTALLGRDTDRKVAAELGIGNMSVTRKRHILGIPPFRVTRAPRQARVWDADAIALLGTMSDRKVAKLLARSVSAVQWKRTRLGIAAFGPSPKRIEWTPEMVASLGSMPDTQLAERFGMSPETVRAFREKRGIPPCVNRGGGVLPAKLRRLLERPSVEVRLLTGLRFSTIQRLRQEHGIEARNDGSAGCER